MKSKKMKAHQKNLKAQLQKYNAQSLIDTKFIEAVKKYTNKNDSIDSITSMIKMGANINYIDENGENALLILLKGDEPIKTDLIKILLSEKTITTDIFINTCTQKTILEHAAEIENHTEAILICKKLVEKGAIIQDKEKKIDAIFFADEAYNEDLVIFFENELQKTIGDNTNNDIYIVL